MGDFFSPSPGYPPPPPEPDIPTPDFKTIGAGLATGLSSGPALFGWLKDLLNMLLQWVATVVGWLVGLAGQILAFLVRNLSAADEAAQSGYADLVASELQALFGISYNSAALQGVKNSTSRADLGSKVAAAILQSIFAPSTSTSGSGITPSDAAAKKFLGTVATMEVEGWLHSWIFDALSYHELEKFGDLKDGIARVLGLGRMSRQVFAPPLKVFVHDPYLALLNQTYRPQHLDHTSAVRQFFRGELSRQQLSTILGNQGWSEQYIDFLINEHQKYLSDAEVDYLVARGMWNQDQAVKYLAEQGWDLATAQTRLAILHDQRIDRYRREIVTAAMDAMVRGEIPSSQLQTIVQASGLTDDEQTWLIRVAGVKRELHATHIGRGDIERLIKEHVMNFSDLQAWAVRNQMPIDEERFLELGLAVDETKAAAAAKAKADAAAAKAAAAAAKTAAAAAKAAQARAQAPDKGISVSEAETLVVDGIWTFDHLTTYLQARGYSASAIDAITHLLHVRMAKAAANGSAAAGTRTAAAAKGLNLAEVEKAVVEGILSISDLENYLHGHGFEAGDIQVLVELTQHEIDLARTKAQAKAAAAAKAGAQSISLAELEHAVRLGLTSQDTYTAALRKAGFDQMSIDLLVGILKSQMAADAAAAAKRNAAPPAAAAVGLSLPQLEQEIIAGIRPIADYTAALVKLGYNAADQASLTQLLQLRVNQAKITAEKRTAAGEALTARGLSLANIERAVKLQVSPIADYKAALQAAGFDAHAVDILVASLTKEIAATAAAQSGANRAAGQVKPKGISLADEQRAVLEGVKPISDYTTLLTTQGFTADVVTTMTRLLQLKLDQQAAALARHSDAVGNATQHGINLQKEEAAVLAGDVTMAQYTALLQRLGYDNVDRAILQNLLQDRLDAAAAKAARAAPPPP